MPLLADFQKTLAHGLHALPDGLLRALSGGATIVSGRTLDAKIQFALALAGPLARLELYEPATARALARRSYGAFDLEAPPLERVEDFQIAAVPARLYVPEAAGPAVLVYYHGGGFVLGDLDSHDAVLRHLAARSACRILSVDYRRAPEHKFPACVDDALLAYAWVRKQAEYAHGRVLVGGDSAGGHLAFSVARLAREQSLSIPDAQFLIYPLLDMSAAEDHGSRRQYGSGFFLTNDLIRYFKRHALTESAVEHTPQASPLLYERACFHQLPPTWIFACGFDPLLDDSTRLHEILEAVDVPCKLRIYDSLIHGALNMTAIADEARVLLDDLAAAVRSHASA